MISVKEAKSILQKNTPSSRIQVLPLEEVAGLRVAEPVFSPMDVPSFDNSAMDGYAIQWNNSQGSWQLEGEIAAGATTDSPLQEGKATRIFTGAPVPQGADTVIPQEWITIKDGEISFDHDRFQKGDNVRLKGAQTKSGDKIMEAGTLLSPGGIGLLASVGVHRVPVMVPPTVGVILTGNEIKEVGQKLEFGEIYNANGPILNAYLQQVGIGKIEIITVKDNPDILRQAINKALASYELIILSGGISVGDYDYVKEGLESAGVRELFYKIKQKPGKPLYVGIKGEQMIFALPGNPASVITCFNQYVKPTIKQWMGDKDSWEPRQWLALDSPVKKNPNLTTFLKVKIEKDIVKILPGQESFNLISFSEADGFAEAPEGLDHLEAGEKVGVYGW
ncbi:gephyrin-like molybdotransferase Glp [Mongoliibacter ruber]|uniref:Molybdopterin molybdenumtransferase n=1 Tax=Mongoliibacter ruber TaxID=1750599 RepID=A0A2T0WD33_9BACT|nr:gephyrin-like molybdotransferase Glp [Mongoliibacter ruber]PRY84556.1 molybdopterin molybdotransferase [Mongoliibacter ruber]